MALKQEDQWSLRLLNVFQLKHYIGLKHPAWDCEEKERLISVIGSVVEMMCRRPEFVNYVLGFKIKNGIKNGKERER